MSDTHWFAKCPKCGAEITEGNPLLVESIYPELGGYEGEQTQCSKCHARFKIEVKLVEVKGLKE